jgi:hypothetical protein
VDRPPLGQERSIDEDEAGAAAVDEKQPASWPDDDGQ